MPYIKVIGQDVTLGGMVAPNDEWFMYEGVIPEGRKLLWDDIKNEIYIDMNEEIAYKREKIELAINNLIQSKVDEYNVANSLSFKDIYSCAMYRTTDGYTHQPFCIAIWNWQTSVWEYARQVLSDVLNELRVAPTVDELLTEIDTNLPLIY